MMNDEAKTLYEEAWNAVRVDHDRRPPSAKLCELCEELDVRGAGEIRPGLLWILGFNNGESAEEVDHKPGWSTHHWIKLCEDAANAVNSRSYVIRERIFWGSPSAGELKRRVGSYAAVVSLLNLHSQVNRILLNENKPLVVWLTGLSYLPETEQAYGLSRVCEAEMRESGKGRLWQAYMDEQQVPWLATHHPSDRLRHTERERIMDKLSKLAEYSKK